MITNVSPTMYYKIIFSGDYITNSCEGKGASCKPCVERFASCVGLPDGNNTYIGELMSARYITCLQERTIDKGVCQRGQYFDHVRKFCTRRLDSGKGVTSSFMTLVLLPENTF